MKRRIAKTLWVVTLSAAVSGLCGSESPNRPNHLAGAVSPYLKRAESEPVDWYPWGDKAWQRARELDRPVLLDVGAVWCGWCERMDRESYTRPEVAAFINANFVPIKVDYDAEPKLVARLERAQALANLPAGVPLTAFVTPGGKLYFGGGYFPRQALRDKPALQEELKEALRLYHERRGDVERDGVDINSGE